ncbi:AfsR/SARP family transcriptional regulator [Streptomyces eurythermus]|uniref:AfsR/SARP family transcriptional regulator n=1 Tax=Streptomyces eurythermus TaxID=42237 RepID=UPI0036F53BE2
MPALLLHAGQTVGLSEIVDVLWHGDPPDSAVNVVHRHIGSLRKPLKPDYPPLGALLVRRAGAVRHRRRRHHPTCCASATSSPTPATPPTAAR